MLCIPYGDIKPVINGTIHDLVYTVDNVPRLFKIYGIDN